MTAIQRISGTSPERPARTIQPGRRGMRGFVPVLSKAVRYESTLERDFLTHLSLDPTLTEVVGQPFTLKFRDRTNRKRQYTPDTFTRHGGPYAGAYLFEIKYRIDLFAKWTKLKPRLMEGRRFARENGWQFMILTEVEIRGPHLDNAVFLRRYRDRPRDESVEEHLVHRLAIIGPADPTKLLVAAYAAESHRAAAIGAMWKLIATGRIQADLSAPLTMKTPIWIDYDSDWAPYDPYSWGRVRRRGLSGHPG